MQVQVDTSGIYPSTKLVSVLASFPGPTQLSVAFNTEKRFFIHTWGKPEDEAMSVLLLKVWHFECGDVFEMRDRILFSFYTELSRVGV